MLKSSISDFSEEEKNRVVNLLKSNIPIKTIRKKTGLDFNSILFLAKCNDIHIDSKDMCQYNIDDNRVLIMADNHLGNKYEKRKFLDKVYNYAIRNNIRSVFHSGDAIQGNIDPKTMDLDRQVDTFVKSYPRDRNITTYLLCGNHEFRAFKYGEDMMQYMFSRKDIKYLGFGKAYLNYHNKFISLSHYISKYYIDIPYTKSFIDFAGHHHYLKVDKNQIYVPTLSRDLKKKDNYSGFLEMYLDNDNIIVEAKEIYNKIDNRGIVLKKRL